MARRYITPARHTRFLSKSAKYQNAFARSPFTHSQRVFPYWENRHQPFRAQKFYCATFLIGKCVVEENECLAPASLSISLFASASHQIAAAEFIILSARAWLSKLPFWISVPRLIRKLFVNNTSHAKSLEINLKIFNLPFANPLDHIKIW